MKVTSIGDSSHLCLLYLHGFLKLDNMLVNAINRILSFVGARLVPTPNPSTALGWPLYLNHSLSAYEEDPDFHPLYAEAQIATQMESSDNALRRQRHFTLQQLLKNGSDEGDIAEIGCWRGLSSFQTARILEQRGFKGTFHIFDSFEGLSEIHDEDRQDKYHQDDETLRNTFACSEDIVKNNLRSFDFIKTYKGWVPDRFSEVENIKFSYVHVDVDLYHPIADCIDFFYPRLTEGGIMVFDDYGCAQFPGAQKAIDEKRANMKDIFFLSFPSGQAFFIKHSLFAKA